MASTPNVGVGIRDVGNKKSPFVTISDDEVWSINRAVDPCSSLEYNPSTPPSKTPAKARLPFEDDIFSPGLYGSSGSAVTISDSAIQNRSVVHDIMIF
ncbi:hypothetical protein MKX03_031907, partial [Papaver bracteatum]